MRLVVRFSVGRFSLLISPNSSEVQSSDSSTKMETKENKSITPRRGFLNFEEFSGCFLSTAISEAVEFVADDGGFGGQLK